LGIETLLLKFDGHGPFCVFKGFFILPDDGRQEIMAALSILFFIKKSLDETG